MDVEVDVNAVYDVARRVFVDELERAKGVKEAQAIGVNISSAGTMIDVLRHLLKGESFTRGLSASDMDIYLASILRDFGHAGLANALMALDLHIRYIEAERSRRYKRESPFNSMEEVKSKYSRLLENADTLAGLTSDFEQAVQKSLQDAQKARVKRLKAAKKTPRRMVVSTFTYVRNPDVVAEVLCQAKGCCQRCGKSAPFFRLSDGTPYLEVHHIIPLAKNGDDTVENAIALCPNCHRWAHLGKCYNTLSATSVWTVHE